MVISIFRLTLSWNMSDFLLDHTELQRNIIYSVGKNGIHFVNKSQAEAGVASLAEIVDEN